jgi:hypothetical protein
MRRNVFRLQQSLGPMMLLLALAYLIISLACGLYYSSIPPSPDQSLYDYIAWQGLHSVQWYVGSFDVTWPGNLIIHEAGIRLFGVHKWTARLTDFLLLQPALFAMFWFLRSAGLRFAAIAVLLIYPIVYVTSGSWMAGHRDIVAMHFLIGSAAIILVYRERLIGSLFLSGLLLGYAVLLRPTYLAFGPALLVVLPHKPFKELIAPLMSLAIGTLAFPLTFAMAGLITHTIGAWFEDGVGFVLYVYQVPLSRIRLAARFVENVREQFLWLAATGLAASIFWHRAKMHAALLFGMAITSVVSFVVQNKGFPYHLGGLIPVFTISALGGTNLAFERMKGFALQPRMVIGAAIALLLCVGIERRMQHATLAAIHEPAGQVAREQEVGKIISTIKNESDPGSRFIQWGWNYDVGFRSERLSASRFMDIPLFSLITPESYGIYASWIRTFNLDLDSAKPTFVLLDLTTMPNGALPLGSMDSGLGVLALHIRRNYKPRLVFKDKILYKRIEDD